MAAVDEHCKLDAVGTAVVEERFDRRANRASGVEDVVDEDHGLALQWEVERRRADDGLRMARRIAAAHLNVVAIEGDVDGAHDRRVAGALPDEAAQTLRE